MKTITPQEKSRQKYEDARKMVTVWAKKVALAARRLDKWNTRAAYHSQRANMTDEQLAAEKSKRLAAEKAKKEKPTLRKIKFK